MAATGDPSKVGRGPGQHAARSEKRSPPENSPWPYITSLVPDQAESGPQRRGRPLSRVCWRRSRGRRQPADVVESGRSGADGSDGLAIEE